MIPFSHIPSSQALHLGIPKFRGRNNRIAVHLAPHVRARHLGLLSCITERQVARDAGNSRLALHPWGGLECLGGKAAPCLEGSTLQIAQHIELTCMWRAHMSHHSACAITHCGTQQAGNNPDIDIQHFVLAQSIRIHGEEPGVWPAQGFE
jgi:hypothetical protein